MLIGEICSENVAHLDRLPAIGAFLIVAPIKIEGGSGDRRASLRSCRNRRLTKSAQVL